MEKFRGTTKLLIYVLIFCAIITYTIGDGGIGDQNLKQQNPNAAERAIGITTPISPWDKARSWIQQAWMILSPLDSQKSEKTPSSTGDVVQEAVAKSFETYKETVGQTAKVAGDVVHITVENVKKTVSSSEGETKQDL